MLPHPQQQNPNNPALQPVMVQADGTMVLLSQQQQQQQHQPMQPQQFVSPYPQQQHFHQQVQQQQQQQPGGLPGLVPMQHINPASSGPNMPGFAQQPTGPQLGGGIAMPMFLQAPSNGVQNVVGGVVSPGGPHAGGGSLSGSGQQAPGTAGTLPAGMMFSGSGSSHHQQQQQQLGGASGSGAVATQLGAGVPPSQAAPLLPFGFNNGSPPTSGSLPVGHQGQAAPTMFGAPLMTTSAAAGGGPPLVQSPNGTSPSSSLRQQAGGSASASGHRISNTYHSSSTSAGGRQASRSGSTSGMNGGGGPNLPLSIQQQPHRPAKPDQIPSASQVVTIPSPGASGSSIGVGGASGSGISIRIGGPPPKLPQPKAAAKYATEPLKTDPDDKGPKQLIVNYISSQVKIDELYELFSQFGQVECAKILFDRDGTTRGFGFVYYASSADATVALKELQSFEFYGKYLRLGYAVPQRAAPPKEGDGEADDEHTGALPTAPSAEPANNGEINQN